MTKMTQEDVIQSLEQRYSAKIGYGCASGIEFTINNLPSYASRTIKFRWQV